MHLTIIFQYVTSLFRYYLLNIYNIHYLSHNANVIIWIKRYILRLYITQQKYPTNHSNEELKAAVCIDNGGGNRLDQIG